MPNILEHPQSGPEIDSLREIQKTFRLLPDEYRKKIVKLAKVMRVPRRDLYYSIIRTVMEKIEPRIRPKRRKIPKKSKNSALQAKGFLRPSPYPMLFDPKILWGKLEPYASNPRRFDELRKTHIKPEIEDRFARQAVKGLSDEGLKQWMKLGGDGVRLLPRVFKEVTNPVAPVKFSRAHFLEVEAEMQKNGGKIGAAQRTVFRRYFDEEQGDSQEGFKKAFGAWVKNGRPVTEKSTD